MKRRSILPELSISTIFVLLVLARAGGRLNSPAAPDDVQTVADVAYWEGKDADPVKHKLDLYLPKGKKNFPWIFFVHGGAWRSGDKKLYPRLGQAFAHDGFGTAVISYRLAPAVQHPAQIEDVARAFAWLKKNGKTYGGDANRIIVSGHSAGAHLVALLALNEKYLKAEGLNGKSITGVIALSGPFRIRGNMFSAFGTEESGWIDASPLDQVRSDVPPFLLLYAQTDFIGLPLLSRQLGEKLREAGNQVTVQEIADRNHISIITSLPPEDDPTHKAMLEFARKLVHRM